jgi:hypothetical protein
LLKSSSVGELGAEYVVAFSDFGCDGLSPFTAVSHAQFQLAHFFFDGIQAGQGSASLSFDRMGQVGVDFLVKQTHTHVTLVLDLPFIRRLLAGEEAEQCGLPGAIGPHDADSVSCANRKVGAFEEPPCADSSAGVLDL